MKLRFTRAALAAALTLPAVAWAADFSALGTLTQSEFRQLTKDLGAATAYRQLASAAPLGLTGFDIAITGTFVDPQRPAVWAKATGGADIPALVPVPGLRIAKGLPLGIDIGAMLVRLPKVDATLAGAELRWALLQGGPVAPALGVRLAATRLSGLDQLSLHTTSLDASVSKGLAFVTPYAGVGVVRTSAKADAVATLTRESPSQTRLFIGAHLNLGLLDVTAEGDRTGQTRSYSTRVGFRF